MENIVQFSYKTFSNRKKKRKQNRILKQLYVKNDKRQFKQEIKYNV